MLIDKKTIKETRKVNCKEFKEKINKLVAANDEIIAKIVEENTNIDDKYNIDVNLTRDNSPLLNPLAMSYEFSQDIYDYIDAKRSYTKMFTPIRTTFIINDNFTEEMQVEAEKEMHLRYYAQFAKLRHKIRQNRLISLCLLIVGFILLVVYVLFSTVLSGLDAVKELFCIFAWVFVWESVDLFFFNGTSLKVDLGNAAQLALMEIGFKKLEQ